MADVKEAREVPLADWRLSGTGLRAALRTAFAWRTDRNEDTAYADINGWWRDPGVLANVGPALADLFVDARPTVVLGPASSGSLLGPLAAVALGLGFVEVRKHVSRAADSDAWLEGTTPPDYRDRQLTLAFRAGLVSPVDRVLFVDDWVDTGGQALGVQRLVERAGASWVGSAVVVDALTDHRVRRQLAVRALLHVRDL